MTPNDPPSPRDAERERIVRWSVYSTERKYPFGFFKTREECEEEAERLTSMYAPTGKRFSAVRLVELRDGESITPPASPDDERESANDRFERKAAAFYDATGMLALGKDDSLCTNEEMYRVRSDAWILFCKGWQTARQQPHEIVVAKGIATKTRVMDVLAVFDAEMSDTAQQLLWDQLLTALARGGSEEGR